MKNVSLSMTPGVPIQQFNSSIPPAPIGSAPKEIYTVSFTVQFDDQKEAMSFATEMLFSIRGYK